MKKQKKETKRKDSDAVPASAPAGEPASHQKLQRTLLLSSIGLFFIAFLLFFGREVFGISGTGQKVRHALTFFGSSNTVTEQSIPFAEMHVDPPKRIYSLFDGQEISAEEANGEYVIGVMIDNSGPARRMQINFNEAPIVMETLAEGGVTRFLAMFSSRQNFEKIGPIRSARPYFFDMLRPFHGLYLHAGGSDVVMGELITQEDILDLDHHYIGNHETLFWRDQTYYAPHNLFTSTEGIKKYIATLTDLNGFKPLEESLFNFTDLPLQSEEKVSDIEMTFSTSYNYDASWKWDEATKLFKRIQNGLQLDVGVNNLIILEAEMWRIPNDPKGRMGMKNVGGGELILFQNGTLLQGAWSKKERSAPLEFFDANGLPLPLLRGKTWIVVLSNFDQLSWK
jgi:hypothetical protein